MLHEIPPTDIAVTYAQRWKLDDVITSCRDASLTFRRRARALTFDWNGDIADTLERQQGELAVTDARIRGLRGQL